MKTTTKLFLTFLIVLSGITSTKAQEKYELMTISYRAALTNSNLISVSIDGKEFLEETIKLEKKHFSLHNTNPFLLKVKEYQEMGWEVIDLSQSGTSNAGIIYLAFLQKKKE
jgi:hypothetical protein